MQYVFRKKIQKNIAKKNIAVSVFYQKRKCTKKNTARECIRTVLKCCFYLSAEEFFIFR